MSRKSKRLQRKQDRWREAREAMEQADRERQQCLEAAIERAARVIGTACKTAVLRMRLKQLNRRQGRAARVIANALQHYVLRRVAHENEEERDRVQAPLCLPQPRKAASVIPEGLVLGGAGGLRKDDLRPFVQAIAQKHPNLSDWAPDDISMYAETVLSIAFHKTSHCGEIHLGDVRSSGFVESLNAVGRGESDIESSVFFSVAQHERMYAAYRSLCGSGWYVNMSNLAGYRHNGGSPVGPVRASRVIDAGLRPLPSASGVIAPVKGGGYGRSIDYNAFVRFFLCEEALRSGTCSKKDVEYCFSLLDQAGTGRIGAVEAEPFYQSMIKEWGALEGELKYFPPIEQVVLQHLDAMGVENEVDHITLAEMTTPGNVAVAGRFFEEIFSGATPEYDLRVEGNGNDVSGDGNVVGDGEGLGNGFGANGNVNDVGGDNVGSNVGGNGNGFGNGDGLFNDNGYPDGWGGGWSNWNGNQTGFGYVGDHNGGGGWGYGWGTPQGVAGGQVSGNGFAYQIANSNGNGDPIGFGYAGVHNGGGGWGYGWGTPQGVAGGQVSGNGFAYQIANSNGNGDPIGFGYAGVHNGGGGWGYGWGTPQGVAGGLVSGNGFASQIANSIGSGYATGFGYAGDHNGGSGWGTQPGLAGDQVFSNGFGYANGNDIMYGNGNDMVYGHNLGNGSGNGWGCGWVGEPGVADGQVYGNNSGIGCGFGWNNGNGNVCGNLWGLGG